MRVPSQFLRQQVTVQDRTPNTGDGPGWRPARTVRCRVDWARTLVRGPQGEDITVIGTLILRPEDDIPVGARVTVDGDKRTAVTSDPIYGPGARLAGRKVTVQ